MRAAGIAGSAALLLLLAGCGGGGEEPDGSTESDAETEMEETRETMMESETNGGGTNGAEGGADILAPDPDAVVVSMRTTLGEIRIELFPNEAPISAANFQRYVEDGFYDGTIFHRVVRGFVIQGGGFTAEMEKKDTHEPIRNEANNGLLNSRGTLSMARTNDPHSATSQFFVNTKDNAALDHRNTSPRGWGYAVFGRVISGMDVVDEIEGASVVSMSGMNDVPAVPIVIEEARVVSE